MVLAAAVSWAAAGVPRAWAHWERVEDVELNTAWTLPRGTFAMGVFMPLQYGVTERFTVGLNPAYALLLTPNVSARWNVYRGRVAVTLRASYLQTFLTERAADQGGGFPGTAEAGVLVGTALSRSVALTFEASYLFDFATHTRATDEFVVEGSDGLPQYVERRTRRVVDSRLEDHGVGYGLAVDWRIDRANLVALQYRGVVLVGSRRHEIPQVIALYAHAWQRTRVGVGAAFGRFPIRTGSSDLVVLPVYPVADLWIRF